MLHIDNNYIRQVVQSLWTRCGDARFDVARYFRLRFDNLRSRASMIRLRERLRVVVLSNECKGRSDFVLRIVFACSFGKWKEMGIFRN